MIFQTQKYTFNVYRLNYNGYQVVSKLLRNKKGLILGIANQNSIAYSIAESAVEHGASLAVTYQTPELEKRVFPLCEQLSCDFIHQVNVINEEDLQKLANTIRQKWGKLDFIVHSVAYSDRNELRGRLVDSSVENFLSSMNISCYSLISVLKHMEGLMIDGGSVITMTYHGSQKVIPNYNVMGVAKAALEASVRYLAYDLGPKNIRVNAISAGPIRTLASSAIGDFKSMLESHRMIAALKRNTTQKDVANSSMYLLSNLSDGVTGEVHYVDSGYSIMGFGGAN